LIGRGQWRERLSGRGVLVSWRPAALVAGALLCMSAAAPATRAAASVASAGSATLQAAGPVGPQPCAASSDFVSVLGQGDLCRRGGTTVLRLPNGRHLSMASPDRASALTHGITAPASIAAPGSPAPAATTPLLPQQCVDPSTHQHVELYYAHFADQTDRFSAAAPSIAQQLIDVDTTYLNYDATTYFGIGAHLFAECDAALKPVVHDITLSTPMSSTDFSSIASDMQGQGHVNPRAHYWIWTDGNPLASLGYAGQSSLESDDSASVSNSINNSYEYSVNYGYTGASGARVFAHENGHAMGAVQLSAPHSTGGFHCTDGLDVMCYNDGGPQGSLYTDVACARAANGTSVFDCQFDDYFNPAAAPGSYLATHWNVGGVNNRWLLLQPANSTTALVATPTNVNAYQPLALTATVRGPSAGAGMPGGSVTFYDGSSSLATSTVDGSGVAQYTAFLSTVGTHSLTAAYSGSGVYAPSTSPAITESVQPGAPPVGIHLAALDGAGTRSSAITVDDSAIYARSSNGSSFGARSSRSSTLFYGTRGTVFANLDGPGRPASAVAINDNSIYVMKNVNGSFGAPENWSTRAFYGSRATVLADIDGSGRASAVAINDNSIWVMLNTGSGFSNPQLWSTASFFGTRSTSMAVVDSSGRASPVAINDSSIWVMPNKGPGAGFGAPSLRSTTTFYGNRGTFMADVDGRGIASPVAINDDSIWVMRSFSAPSPWSSEPFYGSWMYLADVDGSGRASAVAVTTSGIWVKRNYGGGFGAAGSWLNGPYFGTR
jgi:hypothetical protein